MVARVYNPVVKPLDRLGLRDWRAWATARACDRVLEIGAGTGLNFSYYGACATVVAFDPDPDMLEEIENSESAAARVLIVRAGAQALPFPDECFDAGIGTLVFCTIPQPLRALKEVRRVLKPGASLRLVEHVRGRNPLLGGLMDAATPFWKSIAGGCHLNRNTLEAVGAAGFDIIGVEKKWRGLLIGIDARK